MLRPALQFTLLFALIQKGDALYDFSYRNDTDEEIFTGYLSNRSMNTSVSSWFT